MQTITGQQYGRDVTTRECLFYVSLLSRRGKFAEAETLSAFARRSCRPSRPSLWTGRDTHCSRRHPVWRHAPPTSPKGASPSLAQASRKCGQRQSTAVSRGPRNPLSSCSRRERFSTRNRQGWRGYDFYVIIFPTILVSSSLRVGWFPTRCGCPV